MTIEAATVNLPAVVQETDFNVHMSQESIVGLMALMCAVISIMGFLSVLPWHDICRSRDEYMATKLANTGLKKAAIRALSSLVYSKLRSGQDTVECPICLADFIEDVLFSRKKLL
ncbi:hypothetical protein SUGI_0795900 [Cryptomeria japonica]|nr:hypothetical protein SUGI_0795900 [Cryptomeria japonica]